MELPHGFSADDTPAVRAFLDLASIGSDQVGDREIFSVAALSAGVPRIDEAVEVLVAGFIQNHLGHESPDPLHIFAGGECEIEPGLAERILEDLFARDMAYAQPIDVDRDPRECAEAFVRLFGPDGRFFSNLAPVEEGGEPYDWAISSASFDAGVVGLGNKRIGLMWFGDEG